MRPNLVLILGVGLTLTLVAGSPCRAGLLADGSAEGPGPALKALVSSYCEAEARDDPLDATFRGDHRFDDRLPDLSLEARDARIARRRTSLEALAAIDPAGLDREARIERELLAYTLETKLAAEPFRGHLIPLTHLGGSALDFAEDSVFHPAATVGDLENFLGRLNAFPSLVDQTLDLMRRGMTQGRMPPKVSIVRLVPQLRALAAPAVEQSPLYGIVGRIPADWGDAARSTMTERVRAAIAGEVLPAYARLADFVDAEYLPACRDSIGLCDTPDGQASYAARVRAFTTTGLTPEAVHDLGLAEVAKAREAMDAIRRDVGFAGDLKAFLAQLRDDPRWRNTSEAEMLGRFRSILREMDEKLPQLFGHLPQADYVLVKVPAYRAASASSGSYASAPADGSRPAYFQVNTSNPTTRPTYTMQALAYHEAVPGHHLQLSLAHEAPGRSAFRARCRFTAFSEGWALYAERLPEEVGLYHDPYAVFGRLELDAWRSARLVVDTGIHSMHWSRDQAIAYLEAISACPRSEVEREVDRYIAWPGQALAYKVGELKIRDLRARAESQQGAAFDLRAFHDRLLAQGSLPLTMLERQMAAELSPVLARDGR